MTLKCAGLPTQSRNGSRTSTIPQQSKPRNRERVATKAHVNGVTNYDYDYDFNRYQNN
jgi:hypothetical protein